MTTRCCALQAGVVLGCLLLTCSGLAQVASAAPPIARSAPSDAPPGAGLDEYLASTRAAQNYVGLGACLIKGDSIVWSGTYGYADREAGKKLAADQIFQLASLSKTMTATALMVLYERGRFALDDDVNGYLPFPVRNPHFPDRPITFRMLLTHTSSFADVTTNSNKFRLGVRGDSPIPLAEVVREALTPGGKYFSADNFSGTAAPGAKYGYSNMAFWLIGYLVECIAKQDFSEFCKANIFTPLGMTNTSWRLRELDTARVAFCYMIAPSDTLSYIKVQHFGVPGYPEGMLRTTMQDFTKFISLFLNKGSYRGIQLLRPETVDLMLTPQKVGTIPSRGFKTVDMGLTWMIIDVEGEQYYTMNGFSGSIFTSVDLSPTDGTAIMFYYTGISMKNMAAMMDITKRLHAALGAKPSQEVSTLPPRQSATP